MATCPLCLFSNSPEAAVCARCGKFRFPAGPTESEFIGEGHTRLLASVHCEQDTDDESGRRTIRGPLTVTKSAVQSSMATVAATAVAGDSDAYSVVTIDTTPAPLAPAPPRLIVIRGEKVNAEYLILNGKNFMGRSADKPVDIDLTGQESSEQVWSSRQHAVIIFDRGMLLIEDLSSLNGTFVNRSRLHPGQQRMLQSNDVIQVGTVQFKVTM
ncbi:FHA domain-containing protein [Limnoglobus roseus]|uniref:Zinc-ribbon domain-containing protein n=1 Tax=Limnoglobus roseus TaxID=2598579 RepID=A0A5C1A4V3_9BACT|nr:FHA domain-containing protein [Limnoglobus roseus]QEL13363.1 zinc-ribbon domain-containing protein [Limnoglobus roseus]